MEMRCAGVGGSPPVPGLDPTSCHRRLEGVASQLQCLAETVREIVVQVNHLNECHDVLHDKAQHFQQDELHKSKPSHIITQKLRPLPQQSCPSFDSKTLERLPDYVNRQRPRVSASAANQHRALFLDPPASCASKQQKKRDQVSMLSTARPSSKPHRAWLDAAEQEGNELSRHQRSYHHGLVVDFMQELSGTYDCETLPDEATPIAPQLSVQAGDTSTWMIDKLFACVIQNPAARFVILWDVISGLLILYDCVTIPLSQFPIDEIVPVQWFATYFWTGDILRNFFVGYEDETTGLVEMRFTNIAKRYGQSWFILDTVVIAVEWCSHYLGTRKLTSRTWHMAKAARVMKVMRLMRLVRCFKFFKLLVHFMDRIQSQLLLVATKTFCIVCMIFLMTHYSACSWYAVALMAATEHNILGLVTLEAQQTTWLHERGLLHEKNGGVLYVACLHWASSQSSMGSTEIYPTNVYEQLFAVGCAGSWLVVFTLFITVLGVLATELRESNQERIYNQAVARRFLQSRQISENLSKKINHFVRVQADCTQRRMLEVDATVLSFLPPCLKFLLHEQIYAPVLSFHRALDAFINKSNLGMLTLCHLTMSECVFSEGERVFAEGSPAHAALFVLEGICDYVPANSQIPDSSPTLGSFARTARLHGAAADLMERIRTAHDPALGESHVFDKDDLRLVEGTVACEIALWRKWSHRGLLLVREHATFAALNVQMLLAIVDELAFCCLSVRCLAQYAVSVVKYFDEEATAPCYDIVPACSAEALSRLAKAAFEGPADDSPMTMVRPSLMSLRSSLSRTWSKKEPNRDSKSKRRTTSGSPTDEEGQPDVLGKSAALEKVNLTFESSIGANVDTAQPVGTLLGRRFLDAGHKL